VNEPLRLVTADDGTAPFPAVLADDRVVAIPDAPRGEDGLIRTIAEWDRFEERARTAAERSDGALSRAAVALLAPLLYPGKLLLAGANYGKHASEMRARPSTSSGQAPSQADFAQPYLFALPTRHVVVGTGADVIVPPWAGDIDWEVELAVVIGKTVRNLAADEAMDAVFGYTILNDVTSRAATRRADGPFRHDWFSGKGIDTFCPMGPCIVPKSDLAAPFALRLTVNAEVMQDGTTDDLVFGIAELVAYASQRVTLDPGDVISTGTPSGVGAGRGVFLHDDDVVVASIAGIGELRNRIVMPSARSLA
jgi:2-keto-4-pentenoate hydratase/2-oxohepta-3-ene-1,7-dioic acid hydratase in catechol pathway